MALLVASLLLAALAPVMTRRMNENMYITGDFSHKGNSEIVDIEFGGKYCDNIISDANGNFLYCEGEYTVPEGFQNITVTAIGAGGGGGTAPTAGFIEYTTPGSTNTFTVPLMTNKLEVTLMSGGAGGGAGGQVIINEEKNFLTDGKKSWTPPAETLNRYVNIMACGGGGGAAGTRMTNTCHGGGGGSGAYEKITRLVNALTVWTLHIGGGGGGGATYTCIQGKNGGYFASGGVGGLACQGYNKTQEQRAGLKKTASGGGVGGNGIAEREDEPATLHEFSAAGGYGSNIAGGGGGGGVWGTSAGGGGGGATRLMIGSNLVHTWAGGGGGASGTCCNSEIQNQKCYSGGAGGGGGGEGGGKGGDGLDTKTGFPSQNGKPGSGGSPNGKPGTLFMGGELTDSVFDTTKNCSGGNTKVYGTGETGKPGAMRISYLSYGPGGSGGGGAAIVPIKNINVVPKEELKLVVGKAGIGHKGGRLDELGIEIPATTERSAGWTTTNVGEPSTLKRGENIILRTSHTGSYNASPGCASGIVGNDTSTNFFSCASGGIIGDGELNKVTIKGFSNTNGHNAGDFNGTKNIITGGNSVTNPYPNASTGGAGGDATTPFTGTCTPGIGGTKENPVGEDASGYGCGGGGGYGLHNGGNGSGGYARISWNIYWDTASNAYRAVTLGAGGGGASGNIIKETIRIHEGQVIKVRIGAGGIGAKVVNNQLIDATDGGTTIFGSEEFIQIKAGGGGGGKSPLVQNGTLVKGLGGKPSNICSVGSKNLISNANYCTKGKEGSMADDDGENAALGGLGASFSYKFADKTYIGKSGGGGLQSTELANSAGKNAEGIASGGGGAALIIYNNQSSIPAQLAHPQGGTGANGRIILQLWE